MNTTLATRDIMEDLLNGGPVGPVPGVEELAALIRFCNEPAGRLHPVASKKVASKKKSTHYLTEEVFEGLTLTRERIGRLLQGSTKARISKSGIVDSALMLLLEEFKVKGRESTLAQHLMAKAIGR